MTAAPSIEEVKAFIGKFGDSSKLILENNFKKIPKPTRDKISDGVLEKKWVSKKTIPIIDNFFKTYFDTKTTDDYVDSINKDNMEDDTEDSLATKEPKRSKPDRPRPNTRAPATKATFNAFPVVGYNLKTEVSDLKDFPDISVNDDVYEMLPKLYLRKKEGSTITYDAYKKLRNKYVNKVCEFKEKKGVEVKFEIFKRKPKARGSKEYIYEYKCDGKKEELSDADTIKVFENYYDMVDKLKLTKTLTNDDVMRLMKSDLIYTIDALDYSTYTKEEKNTLVGYVKEETDSYLGLFGGRTSIDLNKTLNKIESAVVEESYDSYNLLFNLIKDVKTRSIPTLAVKIFNNRSGICMHSKLTEDMKREMWLTALTNVSSIKKRNEHQELWKHILESRIVFNIFMNCAKPAKWLHKGLELIIKNKETIQMAMDVLYPISFTFTPFMCGHSCVETPPEYTTKTLPKMISNYFNSIIGKEPTIAERYNNCSWIYYALKEDINNETVSLVEYVVNNRLTTPKPKSKPSDDSESDSETDSSS